MIHLLVQQPQNLKHRNLRNGRYHLAIIQCASVSPNQFGVRATDDKVEEYSNRTNAGLHRAYVTFSNDEPQNYHEAMQSPHPKEWEIAIATEYKLLKDTGTFEWVPSLPEGRKAIGSRIVFKQKRDGDGNLIKFKARIVARGFSQIPGEYFTTTFSSVAKFTTLRVLLSLLRIGSCI